MHRQLNLNSRTDQLKKERNFHRLCQLEKALAFLCAAHLVSITVGVIPSLSIASAQIVQFDDPILTVSTDAGRKNLTETYIRIAIVDPGKPINGV